METFRNVPASHCAGVYLHAFVQHGSIHTALRTLFFAISSSTPQQRNEAYAFMALALFLSSQPITMILARHGSEAHLNKLGSGVNDFKES